MHDGLGGGGEVGHARVAARTAPVEAADLGWILLLPALALAAALIALLAPLGGRLLLPDPGYHYWMTTGVRKPSVDVGYAIAVVLAIAYAVAIVGLKGALRLRPVVRRALVALVQLGGLALVVACWRAQRGLATSEGAKLYFTPATLLAAAAAALLVCAAVRLRDRLPHGEALRTLARRLDARAVAWACLAVALLATVVWLLPALHTDRSTPSGNAYLSALFLDEAAAVVDGRSPLVNMVAYGNLWPYLVALPLRAFGMTYAVYTATMASITLLALLAVYDLLRRVARSAPLALGLYLPVLATGFFVEQWIATERYDPGTYFGMFPLRYAGPYLLAWLTARQLGRPADGRWSLRLLFALAGLVALNNVDFGGAALVATAAALLVVRRPRERAQLGRLALDALAGLAGALALVTLLTLARDGSLPHLGLLLRYGRVFVNGGFANLPLPTLGLHLVVSATFLAAAAAAAVRVTRTDPGDLLAGMLAWCALFGFGASVYYYFYRSYPEVLVNVFSIWSLTLALLVLAALRGERAARRWPRPATVALAFAFALTVCSLGQVPSPWGELRRIGGTTVVTTGETVPAGGFRQAPVARIVVRRTRPGERVVILSPVGHRVAHDAGVVNVSPYTGLEQMPSREQLVETVRILAHEGGSKVFVAQEEPLGLEAELQRLGYGVAGRWDVSTAPEAWPERTVTEYRAA